jgi:Mor family transcriptional regulator
VLLLVSSEIRVSANGEKYPELLADLAEQAAQLLCSKGGIESKLAAEIGQELAEHLRAHWSGAGIYIPKGISYELSQRDLEIWNKFNGRNVRELAREHDLTEVRIYQILNTVRRAEVKRRQSDLFQ